jgi:hypothetical protein
MRVRFKSLAVVLVVSALTPAARAAEPGGTSPAFGVGVGSLGWTGEVSLRPIGNFVVRLNGNFADVSYDKSVSGTNFTGTAKIVGAGITADWHPFANGFRFSGGGRYHNPVFSGTLTGVNASINGHSYTTSQYGTLTAEVSNGNKLVPYAGIGWDSAHFSEPGLSVALEAGALFAGDPRATLTATKSVPGLQADLDAEAKIIKGSSAKSGQCSR